MAVSIKLLGLRNACGYHWLPQAGLRHKQERRPNRREEVIVAEDYQRILKVSAIITISGSEGREINVLAIKVIKWVRVNWRNRSCWKVQEDYYIIIANLWGIMSVTRILHVHRIYDLYKIQCKKYVKSKYDIVKGTIAQLHIHTALRNTYMFKFLTWYPCSVFLHYIITF